MTCHCPTCGAEIPNTEALRVLIEEREVYVDGQKVSLPPKVAETLRLLLDRPDRVMSWDAIIDYLWGMDIDGGPLDPHNVVTVYVWKIRKLLGSAIIETVHGTGYRLNSSSLLKAA